MAPEVVASVNKSKKQEYDDECDLWACGVLLFILLGVRVCLWEDLAPSSLLGWGWGWG